MPSHDSQSNCAKWKMQWGVSPTSFPSEHSLLSHRTPMLCFLSVFPEMYHATKSKCMLFSFLQNALSFFLWLKINTCSNIFILYVILFIYTTMIVFVLVTLFLSLFLETRFLEKEVLESLKIQNTWKNRCPDLANNECTLEFGFKIHNEFVFRKILSHQYLGHTSTVNLFAVFWNLNLIGILCLSGNSIKQVTYYAIISYSPL